MEIDPKIISSFPKFRLKRSDSGKKIVAYGKSKFAINLFDFLSSHPSVRASFNSMVKAGFVSIEKSLPYVEKLLRQAETSLVYEAKCCCGQILERPHIYDLKKNKFPKQITCISCKKFNNLELKDYSPYYDIDIKDLLKTVYPGNGSVFTISPITDCFECGNQEVGDSSKKINIKCQKCSKLTYISMQVFLSKELNELLKEHQGYWLEWYVWSLLKKNFIVDVGILINKKYEADLIVISKNKKIFIECKDNSNDFLKNLHDIKKDFDYYLLVSTSKYKEEQLENAKKILKAKFIHVGPKDIEKIDQIIDGLR